MIPYKDRVTYHRALRLYVRSCVISGGAVPEVTTYALVGSPGSLRMVDASRIVLRKPR